MLYAPGESPYQDGSRPSATAGSDGTGAWAFPAEDLIVRYFTQSRGSVSTIRLETTIQDALLDREAAGRMLDEMKPLIGTYYANFGPFKNTRSRRYSAAGKPALDIPSQLVFELRSPQGSAGSLHCPDQSQCHSRKTAAGKVLGRFGPYANPERQLSCRGTNRSTTNGPKSEHA